MTARIVKRLEQRYAVEGDELAKSALACIRALHKAIGALLDADTAQKRAAAEKRARALIA